MKKFLLLCTVAICVLNPSLFAQEAYDLVIRSGHVIDPKNNIDAVMDIAVSAGKVVKVGKNIATKQAKQTVNAQGFYVVPGLIDIHTHNFQGTEPDHYLSNGLDALNPDGFTFRVGVTTVVDAGSSGWRNFPLFRQNVIEHSKTRVLAFLNIVGEGMRGGAYEQDTTDMSSKMAALVAGSNRDVIVGFKVAHYNGHEWTPVEHAVAAGKVVNMPVMIDFGGSMPALSLDELFSKHLRPGDIFTHTYAKLEPAREAIYDMSANRVKPFVYEARKKGIVFDVGYGGISFSFAQGLPAIKAGFFPSTISTDLHTASMNNAMKDMMSVMSKFLALGMPLNEVIAASTWTPAKVINRENLGNLSEGAPADITVFNLRKGKFGFFDYMGQRELGNEKFECELTVRDGKIVYDLNGIAEPVVLDRPRPQVK